MTARQLLILSTSISASFIFLAVRRNSAQSRDTRVVRIAELLVYPTQLEAYKTALKEEIEASIRIESGVLTLYAISVKGHPDQIRLFETYSSAAAYQSHLQTPHFKKYKATTQAMVKSLTLLETDPILLGTK